MTRLPHIDHLVWAAPELQAGIDELEQRLGVRAAGGGVHPGWGTRNALIALGPACYLEIIAPDPQQPDMEGRRVFGVSGAMPARLVTWAAKSDDLARRVAALQLEGVDLGEVREGSRRRGDGTPLRWQLTDPFAVGHDGLRPFLIDWGNSEHPALTAPRGCALIGLRAEHPDAEGVRATLGVMGLALPVVASARAALIAVIRTVGGEVELR